MHLLRAFVATAKHGSVSNAALALHLTAGAVSKQVRELELWLDLALFDRIRKRLHLTPAGERYLFAVEPMLAQLEAATLELIGSRSDHGDLHLSSLPSFGAKWLIPRLPSFQAAHPKIALHFVPFAQGYDFNRVDLDCAIRYGDGQWPGATSEYLLGRNMTLIAPKAKRGERGPKRGSDVPRFTLLHHLTVPRAWAEWGAASGVDSSLLRRGPQLDQYSTIIRAVAAGMGLALVPTCLIQQELASGEIAAPFAVEFEASTGYFLCYPKAKGSIKSVVAFRAWLIDQAHHQTAIT